MKDTQIYTVSASEADMRLDRYIRMHVENITQSIIEKLLRKSQIKVNGTKAKSSYRVQPNDQVLIPKIEPGEAPLVLPPRMPNPALVRLIDSCVIYEDDELMVINKPAGVAVQGGNKVKDHIDSILEFLRPELPEKPRIVHRIDKDTSGILLIAKTKEAAQWLTGGFKDKLFTKIYHAIVVGVPDRNRGVIRATIAKREGRLGEKMEVVHDDPYDIAITNYSVIDSYGGMSLLELNPITGRTHQLRVHCLHIGLPILGDGKYGGKAAHPGGERFQLHLNASSITVVYPNGESKTFNVNLPEYFLYSIKYFNLRK